MNIALVTIAYNGYGTFLPQWCEYVSKLTIQPKEVIVVLGKGHKADIEAAKAILPKLQVYVYKKRPTMGKLRNIAISKTTTNWVQYLSVDDGIEPYAIEEYKKYIRKADYISVGWTTSGLGEKESVKTAITPKELYENDMKGFIVGHSPFRRKFWEKTMYMNNDYPNYPFLADMVEQGARFVATERPCTMYLRRADSHARSVLIKPSERARARLAKYDMEQRIKRYYDGRGEV